MDRMRASASGSDLFQPSGEQRALSEVYDFLVDEGEPTEARRTLQYSAPVGRGVLGGDGGGSLPGWAAAAAQMDEAGCGASMAIAPV